jgi:hypothetical protein
MARLNWQKLAEQQKLEKHRETYGFYPWQEKPKPKKFKTKKAPGITREMRDKALAMIRANKIST